jgi:hypothetical protein
MIPHSTTFILLSLTFLYTLPTRAGTTFNLTRIPTQHHSTAVQKILSKRGAGFGFEGYSLGGGKVDPGEEGSVVNVAVNKESKVMAAVDSSWGGVAELTLDLIRAPTGISYSMDVKVGGITMPVIVSGLNMPRTIDRR